LASIQLWIEVSFFPFCPLSIVVYGAWLLWSSFVVYRCSFFRSEGRDSACSIYACVLLCLACLLAALGCCLNIYIVTIFLVWFNL
jgi:hypothetical protein